MKQDATGHAIARERPYLLVALGSIGLAGCGALIIGTFIAPFFVPDYNWISDTISDLAAGHSEIIMDIALYGFAAGLMATALAASHAHLGGYILVCGCPFPGHSGVLGRRRGGAERIWRQ